MFEIDISLCPGPNTRLWATYANQLRETELGRSYLPESRLRIMASSLTGDDRDTRRRDVLHLRDIARQITERYAA